MAVITRKAVVTAPVRTIAKPVAKVAAKVAAPKAVSGFKILEGIEIPAKRAFGKRGVYNDLFAQLEAGQCVEIEVEAEKTTVSKMNGLYNAARRNGANVTMRVHQAGEDGKHGGVIRMWYNGQNATE